MATTSEKNGAAGNSGPGTIGDFASALADAATHWPAVGVPDRDVSSAIALGWQLGDFDSPAETPAGGQMDFGPTRGLDLTRAQISATVKRLEPRLAKTLSDDGITAVEDRAGHGDYAATVNLLYGADPTLGKALELGRRLQTMTTPSGATWTVQQALASQAQRVDELLLALTSVLPANAGHGVHNSLRLWRVAATTDKARGAETTPSPARDSLQKAFTNQGRQWRDILSGQLAAKDVLRTSDYIGTTLDVVEHVRGLWKEAGEKWKDARYVLVGLVLLGIVLMVLAAAGVLHGAQGVIAGATTILAAIGLTWKAIGEFFGRQAAKGEEAVWSAELDWTIAYRMTTNAWSLESKDFGAVQSSAPRDYGHVIKWLDWKAKWPDLDQSVLHLQHLGGA